MALAGTECHFVREVDRSAQDKWFDEEVGNQREPPIAPASRSPALLYHIIMRPVSAFGNKSLQKECNRESRRLQRHEIRLCAIYLLIVNTRSNQNALRLCEPTGVNHPSHSSVSRIGRIRHPV